MKFVSTVIIAMIISFSASAQTTGTTPAAKRTEGNVQKKAKGKRSKSSKINPAAKNTDVTTLTDAKNYKAKWTFEQMLMRRLEIEAEEGERERQRRVE